MKTAIGMVTFGNTQFTKLALDELFATVKHPVDLCLVIGRPDDQATKDLAAIHPIHPSTIVHEVNMGFPSSLNDLYDWAFKRHDYDNLIIMGNDVVVYPNCIDELITEAHRVSSWEVICSCQFDSRSLVSRYPEAQQYFKGPGLEFTDFAARPWDLHGAQNIPAYATFEGNRGGLQDCSLFKRSVFEKIGYFDVNFFPAYFQDNDYWHRLMLEKIPVCSVASSAYFHFWSRTIHQGGGHPPRSFQLNEEFYRTKWGGSVGAEAWEMPFEGKAHMLNRAEADSGAEWLMVESLRRISARENEGRIIEHWKKRIAS